jgi:hypothetical protein
MCLYTINAGYVSLCKALVRLGMALKSSTLASIGTTIWELGQLECGKGRKKYWSGRGVRIWVTETMN